MNKQSWSQLLKNLEPVSCDGCKRLYTDEDEYDIFVIKEQPEKRYCEDCYNKLK